MLIDRNKLFQTVLLEYGPKMQILKAIEELSELLTELSKIVFDMESRQEKRTLRLSENLFLELADVEIMMQQLVNHIFNCRRQVDKRKEEQLERLFHNIYAKGLKYD